MTWTRYDVSASNDALRVIYEPSTETMVATSRDGIAFSDGVAVSNDAAATAIDVFPSLYVDQAKAPAYVLWLRSAGSAATSVELPVGGDPVTDRVDRPLLRGYTARVTPTATPGIYWGVWVEGATGRQKLRQAFFTR